MSARRSKFEFWAEILESCLRATRTQTWLLRKTRLKTSKIKESLQFLLSRDLIEQLDEDGLMQYRTTHRGEEALKRFYSLVNEYFDLVHDS